MNITMDDFKLETQYGNRSFNHTEAIIKSNTYQNIKLSVNV